MFHINAGGRSDPDLPQILHGDIFIQHEFNE